MKNLPTILAAAGLLLFNTSCLNEGGTGSGYRNPSAPQVQLPIPSSLRPVEQSLLPEFEEALRDAGFVTTQQPAEYQAGFRIQEGPINAETTMNLSQNGRRIASALGRQGGITKVLSGNKFAEQSFFVCLRDFESQLPRMGSQRGGAQYNSGGGAYQGGSNGYQNQNYNRYPANGGGYNNAPPAQNWATGW